MASIQISFYGATDKGRVRTNNEDTLIAQYLWDDRHILLAAIDGMGGEEGGEVAAAIARDTMAAYLNSHRNDTMLNLVKRAMAEANNEIVRQKELQPKYRRMGCVATAGIIDAEEETLSIAHVGDSRLYRYGNGELAKLSHDHSLVGYQEEQGILTEEQAMHHPRRSVIERCLGDENHEPDDKGFIEAGVFPLVSGETYVFCSDGLSDVLTSAQIAGCLNPASSPADECRKLIDRANEAGGKDNITVVVAQVGNPRVGGTWPVSDGFSQRKEPKSAGPAPALPKKGHRTLTALVAVLWTVACLAAGIYVGKTFFVKPQAAPPVPQAAAPTPKDSTAKQDTLQKDSVSKNSLKNNLQDRNQQAGADATPAPETKTGAATAGKDATQPDGNPDSRSEEPSGTAEPTGESELPVATV